METIIEKKIEKRQIAIRLSTDQWKKLKYYLADHQISFQHLIIELLDGKIGLK